MVFLAASVAFAGGLGPPLRAGAAVPPPPLTVSISDVSLIAHTLHVGVAVQGLGAATAGPATAALTVELGGVPIRATVPLSHLPPNWTMDLDLQAGSVRVGGTRAGSFAPVQPFTDNMRFPVEVAVRHGSSAGTARTRVTLLLPTVIVPGYPVIKRSNPDRPVLESLRRHGYADSGPSPTLFWFRYPSHQIDLKEGARLLAEYVHRVVLPATYAGRLNVVGYSVGGLLARWNVEYNLNGWSTLVNRLVLIGVPNEGAVMAYTGQHAPSFLPFTDLARTQLAQTMIPVFPFWRPTASAPWSLPPDARNPELTQLNARPIPAGIRVYLLYGSHDPADPAGPQTAAGVTGQLPGPGTPRRLPAGDKPTAAGITGQLPAGPLSFEPGDGIILAASAEGLPIHGMAGVPGLADRAVLRVNLGSIYHLDLLQAGADRIAGALTDRFLPVLEEGPAARCCTAPHKPRRQQ